MRDINDGLIKFPFNSELSALAAKFGEVLRVIVDTIDRRGLKRRFLRKHKKQVNKVMDEIESTKYTTEAAISLRKRFVKHRTKLFTFLDYDGVPWNNNNAEHAVRAFTRIRNMMSTSTAKGTKEYAILLSVQQTLKYRNMNLLKFLRSGSTEIEDLT
jgi:Transposase IS66 family